MTETAATGLRICLNFGYLNRSEEHTSELQSRLHLVCRLLLPKREKSGARRRVGGGQDDMRWPDASLAAASDARSHDVRCCGGPGPWPLLRPLFLMIRPPPTYTLSPSTTLFRS